MENIRMTLILVEMTFKNRGKNSRTITRNDWTHELYLY